MNLQIISRAILLASVISAFASNAHAQGTAKMLVTINPQEYTHPITLWRYYHNFWFYQGPLLEPIAIKMLNEKFGEVGLCSGNLAANTLVTIKPGMFYNPMMTQYYGKLTAQVYSGSGKIIGSYVAESEKSGFLDVYPERQIADTYHLTMQKLIEKMQADEVLQRALKDGIPATETNSPCSIVMTLPEGVAK
jgi:hypothetical protein